MDRIIHPHYFYPPLKKGGQGGFAVKRVCQGILPPFILKRMAESPDKITRRWALENLAASAAARATRTTLSTLPQMAAIPSPAGKKHRLIYDAQHKPTHALPGKLVRSEGEKGPNGPSKDPAVNEAYDYSGDTYDFYKEVLNRNSLDDRGMSLISSVHVGQHYANAFWDGEQMAYGDGDGRTFVRFTKSLDVVAHELTHGVVSHTANLEYQGESGALNEHYADVMGILVKQWRRNQTVKQADWLVGADILIKTFTRKALRSFSAPGTAYVNDPDIGTDPQPAHMKQKYEGEDDYGGVHINSGIPNHAFYLAAMQIGGKSWEKTGKIWYQTLLSLSPRSDFAAIAQGTVEKATILYGSRSPESKAVKQSWISVGIPPK
ncbi:MAG: M4 family metallopeptidase [Elusimicrobia bacterium]|nr:M4 family metallopeptidase [Elusimicrobiota bacterium]